MTDPAAIAHAELLAVATHELIRYAREGATTARYPFGMDDISAGLAEALHFVLTSETAALRANPHPADAPEMETTNQLLGALATWLDVNGFELPEE